jgi:MoaA/NifB/PqqE/SkfB family radical SAM enzyme
MKSFLKILLAGYTAEQKINYLKYRFSKKDAILDYSPITISVVATGRCTLSCNMCPTHSNLIPKDYEHIQRATRDMSFETFKDVVDKFPEALNVQIIGSGEPMLNKDFFKMVDYAATERRMKVKTFSNGTTIRDNIDNIIRSSLEGITVSVNGHSPEEFTRLTGAPADVFYDILDATRKLILARDRAGSKLKIKISFIIDKINYVDIPLMIKAGEKLGADQVFLCHFLPAPYRGFTSEERMIFTDEAHIINKLRMCYLALPAAIRKKVIFPQPITRDPDVKKCESHFTQIRVDGEGRASSCSIMLLNMDSGACFTEEGVWNNEFFRKMREKFLGNKNSDLPGPCTVCPENRGIRIDR